jgi:hypothetical protein
MAGVEEVELHVRQVTLVGMAAVRREESQHHPHRKGGGEAAGPTATHVFLSVMKLGEL